MLILKYSYWAELFLIGFVTVFAGATAVGLVLFPCMFFLVSVPMAFYYSKLTIGQFYADVLMSGVRKISYSFTKLGRKDPEVVECWEPVFLLYWGILIKFIDPYILMFILISIFKEDVEAPFEGFSARWQAIGWAIPATGLLVFIITAAFCSSNGKDYDLSEFELDHVYPKAQGADDAVYAAQ